MVNKITKRAKGGFMITKRKYPWVGEQTWSDILFLHWPDEPEVIRPFIPKSFLIDTFDHKAWISIVVFNAVQSSLRFMPKWTAYRPVTQINVRTYVKHPQCSEPGVHFFALHANSLLAVLGARNLFGLPFSFVRNDWQKMNQMIHVSSIADQQPLFSAQYKAQNNIIQNDLATFLTERYCIWNTHRNRLIKIPIQHQHWTLYEADVLLQQNELFHFLDKKYISNFIAHYSSYQHAMLYPYETYGFQKLHTNEISNMCKQIN